MKIKKTLLAGATAATVAFAGVGVASAQDGSSDLPGSLTSLSSDAGTGEGSGEGSSDISGSLDDLFADGGILGSFAPGEGDDWIDGVKGISAVISLIVAAVGLGGLFV
ncbi:hypothetical protein [Corynebacterium kalidii]|uniref:Secreted protein n=1 Tax=Corynebacterium kalidii TaxID=2931982 RepID=A0A9X1WHT2_9CORY|nr:hypothetical protein [Corynebacterium kalidii]MCJ7857842.1 hypothetical protein [Corynebacterium kalidii]